MQYRLGIEDIEPGHWVAWVFDLLGCYAKGKTREQAVTHAATEISDYLNWLAAYGRPSSSAGEEIEVVGAEEYRSFVVEDDYIVNAFFDDDKRPLSQDDIEYCRWLLGCTRKDLFKVIEELTPALLDCEIEGEVQGSIRGVLNHIAGAEWWYFDKFGWSFAREEMPVETMDMLDRVRRQTYQLLPDFIGCEMIVEKRKEKWSGRKIMRRTIWHERSHTKQIIRYSRELSVRGLI